MKIMGGTQNRREMFKYVQFYFIRLWHCKGKTPTVPNLTKKLTSHQIVIIIGILIPMWCGVNFLICDMIWSAKLKSRYIRYRTS